MTGHGPQAWPAHLVWTWGRDEKHGITLTNPRGTRWKFHMRKGPCLRRIDDEDGRHSDAR